MQGSGYAFLEEAHNLGLAVHVEPGIMFAMARR